MERTYSHIKSCDEMNTLQHRLMEWNQNGNNRITECLSHNQCISQNGERTAREFVKYDNDSNERYSGWDNTPPQSPLSTPSQSPLNTPPQSPLYTPPQSLRNASCDSELEELFS